MHQASSDDRLETVELELKNLRSKVSFLTDKVISSRQELSELEDQKEKTR